MSDHVKEPNQTSAAGWLVGGGEMGKLVRSMDWSRTPLDPIGIMAPEIAHRRLCLASNFPISLAWGPSRLQFTLTAIGRSSQTFNAREAPDWQERN